MLPKHCIFVLLYFFHSAQGSLEPCGTVGQLKSDAEKCEIFHQCSYRGWVQLTCPDGLVFNDEILVCDWPKSGTRCGGNSDQSHTTGHGACTEIGELKAEGVNCDRFYQCTRYGWAQLTCGHDLTFNPEKSICDWSKPGAKCGGNANHNEGTDGQDLNDDAMLEICESLGELKPDTANCEHFYQCTLIGWAPVRCQEGFFYNSELSVCDLPKPGTKCDKSEDDERESCTTVGELKSSDKNCQKFYQCTSSGWVQLSCPDGLFFNKHISVCDWPKPGTKCSRSNDDCGYGSCDAVGALKPEGDNCDLFYQCTRNGWMPLTCGHGLVFHKDTSVCDWPKSGLKCVGSKNRNDYSGSSDPDQDDDSMLEICEKLGQLKPDSENCDRFFQCTPIGWAPLHCHDGFYFNKKLAVCDRSEDGSTCEREKSCETVGEFKADEENCRKFYQCTNNGWKSLTCEDGLFFNSQIRVCDWPEPGSKCDKSNSSDEENFEACDKIGSLKEEYKNCDRFFQCTRLGWTEVTCGHDLTFNPEISICDWPKPGIRCRGNTNTNDRSRTSDEDKDDAMLDICERAGLVKPDAEHCDRFYQCTHIGWAPVHCPEGFYFNQKLSVCDRSKDGSTCGNDNSKYESCESLGDLKAKTRNCDRFYQCTRLGWSQLTCGHDLTFNPDSLLCDWPKPGLKCEENGNQNNQTGNSAEEDDDTMLEICDSLGQLKPDGKNCERFYQCTRIGWAPVYCEEGFYFNDTLSMCDRSEDGSKCKNADDDDNSKLELCESVGELKSDTNDCHGFYQCTNSGWKRLTCEDELVFNPEIKVCDWPKPGFKCGQNDVADDHSNDHDENQDTDLDSCKNVGEIKADNEHCDLYYLCTSCGWTLVPCEPGLLFDSRALACKNSDLATCATDSTDYSNDRNHDKDSLEPCKKVGELKADPNDCNRYYQCTTYGWQNMPCYDNLAFNPDKLICDYPYNVSCRI